MNITKAQLKEDKIEALEIVTSKLAHAYCFDGDTDFITIASEISKHYKENMRVYGFLYRNRHEIDREARASGSRRLHQLEIGD
ncbi:hypothetical protein [Burkholderia cenocepacia]|uniref:hypothetical protein n=1 Tax=Burkholderia cenocepacia TaxID=95486 RepID=UPI00264F48FE|nr:hypothetical protein [Burkholderia cenocepacia]MDN7678092.1 hypothetical protein [Burkholderia cenocepacia]